MSSQSIVPSSSVPATTSATSHPHRPPQSPISYILYLHREELRKRKISCMRISHTKFQLTHELITKTIKDIHKCTPDDLNILSRETIFNRNLKRQIARMQHLEHMQMLRQQQNKKLQTQQRPQQNPLQQQQHYQQEQHYQRQQHHQQLQYYQQLQRYQQQQHKYYQQHHQHQQRNQHQQRKQHQRHNQQKKNNVVRRL